MTAPGRIRPAFLPVAVPNIEVALLIRGRPSASDPLACAPCNVHHVPAATVPTTIHTSTTPKNNRKGVICLFSHIRRMHYVLPSNKFFLPKRTCAYEGSYLKQDSQIAPLALLVHLVYY